MGLNGTFEGGNEDYVEMVWWADHVGNTHDPGQWNDLPDDRNLAYMCSHPGPILYFSLRKSHIEAQHAKECKLGTRVDTDIVPR